MQRGSVSSIHIGIQTHSSGSIPNQIVSIHRQYPQYPDSSRSIPAVSLNEFAVSKPNLDMDIAGAVGQYPVVDVGY